MDFKYKTRFNTIARVVSNDEKNKFLAIASLDRLKSVFGVSGPPKSEDLLALAGLLFTGGIVNKNDDGVTIEDSLNIYPTFQNKFLSIEHERSNIRGFLSSVGLAKYLDNSEITKEEVLKDKTPFNVSVGCLVWSILSPKLSEYLVESSNPLSDEYQTVSLSFEVGFDSYNIGIGSKIISESKIITPEDKDFETLDQCLKCNKGSGKTDKGERVFRILAGNILGLGASLVAEPASGLKGILAIENQTSGQIEEKSLESSNLSETSQIINKIVELDKKSQIIEKNIIAQKNCVITQQNNTKTKKSMDKITKREELTDESLKECKASVVIDFIDEQIKLANESWKAKVEEKDKGLKETNDKTESLASELKQLGEKFAQTQKELEKLNTEASQRLAQETFTQRMASLDNIYELTQEERFEIAAQVKNLDDDGFKKISKSYETLLKEKNKEFIKARKEKEVKAQETTASVKVEEKTENTQSVVDNALDNATKEKASVTNTTTASNPTLAERMKAGFKMENWISAGKK